MSVNCRMIAKAPSTHWPPPPDARPLNVDQEPASDADPTRWRCVRVPRQPGRRRSRISVGGCHIRPRRSGRGRRYSPAHERHRFCKPGAMRAYAYAPRRRCQWRADRPIPTVSECPAIGIVARPPPMSWRRAARLHAMRSSSAAEGLVRRLHGVPYDYEIAARQAKSFGFPAFAHAARTGRLTPG